jgi:hypothetical protein
VSVAYSDDVNGPFRREVNKVGAKRRWHLQSWLRLFRSVKRRSSECGANYDKQHYFVSVVVRPKGLTRPCSIRRTFCSM